MRKTCTHHCVNTFDALHKQRDIVFSEINLISGLTENNNAFTIQNNFAHIDKIIHPKTNLDKIKGLNHYEKK